MLERQDVGDGYLLLCSYCFDLIYAKHLKLKKRKTRILSFGARTFFFRSVISTTLAIKMAFLMFPPWLVVAACSVSCLEASGNPNDIPRRREHSEMDLQSPSPAALQMTFQKEDRFGELPRSHCLENSRLFIHFQKSVKAGKKTWN